jgi:hypothetical protein
MGGRQAPVAAASFRYSIDVEPGKALARVAGGRSRAHRRFRCVRACEHAARRQHAPLGDDGTEGHPQAEARDDAGPHAPTDTEADAEDDASTDSSSNDGTCIAKAQALARVRIFCRPSMATPRAATATLGSRDPGMQVSVLAIGSGPIAIAVTIVGLAGVVLFGAWFMFGRRRPGERDGLLVAPAAPHAAPRSGPGEDGPPSSQRPAGRRKRSFRGDRRSGHLEDVFAGSDMRRVVREDQVQLLNVPNATLGTPLTELGSGREVELLELDEGWAKVRTPWGEVGWVQSSRLDKEG